VFLILVLDWCFGLVGVALVLLMRWCGLVFLFDWFCCIRLFVCLVFVVGVVLVGVLGVLLLVV